MPDLESIRHKHKSQRLKINAVPAMETMAREKRLSMGFLIFNLPKHRVTDVLGQLQASLIGGAILLSTGEQIRKGLN